MLVQDRHDEDVVCLPGSNHPGSGPDFTCTAGGAGAAHLELLEGAVCHNAATPQDHNPVAAGQLVPLMSHQQPCGPLWGARPLLEATQKRLLRGPQTIQAMPTRLLVVDVRV